LRVTWMMMLLLLLREEKAKSAIVSRSRETL
jgi:hypothetical protein